MYFEHQHNYIKIFIMKFFHVKKKNIKINLSPPLPSFLDPCNWKQKNFFLGVIKINLVVGCVTEGWMSSIFREAAAQPKID